MPLLFAVCAFLTLRRAKGDESGDARLLIRAPGRGDPLAAWVGLAALGSILLLATTNAISQWSAVVPFLWILPLSLYLLTFVFAFGYPRFYRPGPVRRGVPAAGGRDILGRAEPASSVDLLLQLRCNGATLFAGCMICHAELVKLQPTPTRLPKFYLAIAAGGALGGVLRGADCALVFSDYFEHPLVLCAIAAIAVVLMLRDASAYGAGWARRPPRRRRCVFVSGVAVGIGRSGGERVLVERVRNFYGVVKVVRENEAIPSSAASYMLQAGVEQGEQFQAPSADGAHLRLQRRERVRSRVAHNARRRGGPAAPLRSASSGSAPA